MNQAAQPKKYFDSHLQGLGYLSRVREISAAGAGRTKAKPFLACSIASFHGDPDAENGVVYLPLDLIVSADKAKQAVRAVMNDANDADTKVLIGFRTGDHRIELFTRKQGDHAGETGAVLKGRLIKVFWIKVDGETVYRDDSHAAGDDSTVADREADTVDSAARTNGSSTVRCTQRAPSRAERRPGRNA